MKTAKNIILCFLFCCYVFNVNAQENFYRASPSVINAYSNAGTTQLEINHQISITQFQIVQNVSKRYFLFGTYNFDHTNKTFRTFIFGDKRTIEKNNTGFSVGAGIQNLGSVGSYENLELLLGFEKQKVDNIEFFTDAQSPRRDHLIQEYYKVFTQINLMKNRTNFDFGYSLKASYLKFTKIEYNTITDVFEGKSLIFLDPTVSFNYKFLTNKNLIATSQIGLSLPLSNLENRSVSSGEIMSATRSYLASPIFKVGIQYRFNLK